MSRKDNSTDMKCIICHSDNNVQRYVASWQYRYENILALPYCQKCVEGKSEFMPISESRDWQKRAKLAPINNAELS